MSFSKGYNDHRKELKMKKSAFLAFIAFSPLALAACSPVATNSTSSLSNGTSSSSSSSSSYEPVSSSESDTAFSAFSSAFSDIASAANEGIEFLPSSNGEMFALTIKTDTPFDFFSSTTSSSSGGTAQIYTYDLGVSASKATIKNNNADSKTNLESEFLMKNAQFDISSDQGDAFSFAQSYADYYSDYCFYSDFSKAALTRYAIETLVNSALKPTSEWSLSNYNCIDASSYSAYLDLLLPLSEKLPTLASSISDALESAYEDGAVTLYSLGDQYELRTSISTPNMMKFYLEDIVTGFFGTSDAGTFMSGIINGQISRFMSCVDSLSFSASLDYSAEVISSFTYSLSLSMDETKVKSTYADVLKDTNTLVTSLSSSAIVEPLISDDSLIDDWPTDLTDRDKWKDVDLSPFESFFPV